MALFLGIDNPVWWLSVGLGCGIGVCYTVASFLINRWAARFESRRFMLFMISGMMARLALALVLVILILMRLSVDPRAFLVAFMGTFAIGLLWEVRFIHRFSQNQHTASDTDATA